MVSAVIVGYKLLWEKRAQESVVRDLSKRRSQSSYAYMSTYLSRTIRLVDAEVTRREKRQDVCAVTLTLSGKGGKVRRCCFPLCQPSRHAERQSS